MRAPRGSRAAGLIAGVALFAVYVATLAPDITFWDAGEFIAAAHSLGIPHPPGTPLFVLLLNVWARLFPFLSYPVATNLLAATTTAVAAGITGALVARASQSAWSGVAAALCAGGMSTVRLNATETEVYAVSLLLGVLTLWCADCAGRLGSWRWRSLTAYLVALAVPLHLSALLAAPAAIYLASTPESERVDWECALALSAVFLLAIAVGLMSAGVAIAGGAIAAVSMFASRSGGRVAFARRVDARQTGRLLGLLAVGAVACSGLLFMLIRARLDPAINQGMPADLRALAYAVARRQYAVAPLWPRQAPFWLQVGNLFEYADWQTALSLAPGVIPNAARVGATAIFAVLGAFGSLMHRRANRRTWRALALLTLCGTLGVVVYVNFKASPSFGYGVLPDDAPREARERDYFFMFGFWGWGIWAGYGAVALARMRGWPSAAGGAIAALPIILNWSAVDRRRAPEASLPREVAGVLLGAAPARAVLFVAGDNDTYPLWAAQEVDGLRRDVSTVTMPLLGAAWYQQEIARRTGLLPSDSRVRAPSDASRIIADRARELDRPVAVDMSVPAADRNQLGGDWTVYGPLYVSASAGGHTPANLAGPDGSSLPRVDTASTRYWTAHVANWRRGRDVGLSTDQIDHYMLDILSCSGSFLGDPARTPGVSLDSVCNRR